MKTIEVAVSLVLIRSQLLVFSVTPFKLDLKKNNKKSKPFNILSPESGKRKKVNMMTLTKSQVTTIFFYGRYAEKRFLQSYRDFYGDAMLVPLSMGTNMAAGNQQKHL